MLEVNLDTFSRPFWNREVGGSIPPSRQRLAQRQSTRYDVRFDSSIVWGTMLGKHLILWAVGEILRPPGGSAPAGRTPGEAALKVG